MEAGIGGGGAGRRGQLQGDARARFGDEGQGEGEGGQSFVRRGEGGVYLRNDDNVRTRHG